MATRVVRGQLALDIGERLKAIGGQVLKLHEYSGDALDQQLRSVGTGLSSQLGQLETLLKSCRSAAKGYPNFPSLRRAIAEGGDKVYEIMQQVQEVQYKINDGDWQFRGQELIHLGQELRLVEFVPPDQKPAVTS